MKLFAAATVAAILAFAYADVSELGYAYNQPAASAPLSSYIPPAANVPQPAYAPAPAPVYHPAPAPVYHPAPAPSAPVSTYIPPAPAAAAPEPVYAPAPAPVYQPAPAAPAPVYHPAPAPVYHPAPAPSAPISSYIPPAPQPAASEVYEQPAQDGYRYRTVHRRVHKQRRF